MRQVTVKTADDRLAVIWPEKIGSDGCTDAQLDQVIRASLKRNGRDLVDSGELRQFLWRYPFKQDSH